METCEEKWRIDRNSGTSDAVAIPITGGLSALIDVASMDLVRGWSWRSSRVRNLIYAVGSCGGRRALIHRLILSAPPGLEVDHINGNGLDNRLCNLRLCSHAENHANQGVRKNNRTSKYRGVHCEIGRKSKPWTAKLGHTKNGVFTRHFLGRFASEVEAARAVDLKSIELSGGFARTNLPRSEYSYLLKAEALA